MGKELLYLGLDVHAENIAVAIAEADREAEVSSPRSSRQRFGVRWRSYRFRRPSSHQPSNTPQKRWLMIDQNPRADGGRNDLDQAASRSRDERQSSVI
jgi:hypothetical protein